MSHHRVTNEDHTGHDEEVDEIRACQPKGTRDDAEAWLEVHQLEDARDEQQNVDAIEGKVPIGEEYNITGDKMELRTQAQLQGLYTELLIR